MELRVAKRVAELLAALQDEHFVDNVDDEIGRDVIERLPQRCIGRIRFEIDLPSHLTERCDLAVFEIRLGKDCSTERRNPDLPRGRAGLQYDTQQRALWQHRGLHAVEGARTSVHSPDPTAEEIAAAAGKC